MEFSRLGGRLFRNNVAKSWIGKYSKLEDGSVLIKNPRRLNSGLCEGSSDLIGWTSVTITADMVGRTLAIFTAIEVKSSTKMKATKEQQSFIHAVNASGGIGVIARELKDILVGVSKYGVIGGSSREDSGAIPEKDLSGPKIKKKLYVQ